MDSHYTMKNYGAIGLAVICWGLAVEKVVADGIQSWTLLIGVAVLTACAGILLHIAFSDLRSWRPVRGTIALALAALSLCVTLPASIGSSSQARDTAVASSTKSAADLIKLLSDIDATEKLVKQADKWVADECKTGVGDLCKGKVFIQEQRQRSLDVLKAELKAHEPAKPVEAGEERIAWVLGLAGLGVSAADVGRVWPILPPLAFELLSAFFLTRGLHREFEVASPVVNADRGTDTAQTSFPVSEPLPPATLFASAEEPEAPTPKRRKRKSKHDNAAAWLKAEAAKNGGIPAFRVVQGRFRLSNASASRLRKEVAAEMSKSAA
jgi:hypothetical protein